MVKKLALALIVVGAIGALKWGGNTKESMHISERIRSEPQYSQLTEDKKQLEARKNPEFRTNEAYGGISAAMMLAELAAVMGGGYLLIGKDYFNPE